MESIFKERVVEDTPEQTETPKRETPNETVGTPNPNIRSLKEENPTRETLEIWEGLNNRKFGEDIFNIRAISHTFPIKAEFGFVDKFIKAEITERGLEPNTSNYKEVLKEFESEAGSEKLEIYKRINRLFKFLQTLRKYRELQKKKEAFKLA